MKGARDFAELFETGQHGKLYLVSQSHARGRTFRIFILPRGEQAIQNGPNAPLNEHAVEVYGIVGGQPGWTERYGWLREGPWQKDFYNILEARKLEVSHKEWERSEAVRKKEVDDEQLTLQLLSEY